MMETAATPTMIWYARSRLIVSPGWPAHYCRDAPTVKTRRRGFKQRVLGRSRSLPGGSGFSRGYTLIQVSGSVSGKERKYGLCGLAKGREPWLRSCECPSSVRDRPGRLARAMENRSAQKGGLEPLAGHGKLSGYGSLVTGADPSNPLRRYRWEHRSRPSAPPFVTTPRAAPLDLDVQTVTPASSRHHRCGSPQ
jgi:hypothetical protein